MERRSNGAHETPSPAQFTMDSACLVLLVLLGGGSFLCFFVKGELKRFQSDQQVLLTDEDSTPVYQHEDIEASDDDVSVLPSNSGSASTYYIAADADANAGDEANA
jgi:hypothetical protein